MTLHPRVSMKLADDFQAINETPVLIPLPEDQARAVLAMLPTAKEIHDETCRELRRLCDGLEIVRAVRPQTDDWARARCVEVDGETFLPRRMFGSLFIAHESFEAKNVDDMRGGAFSIARSFAATIASKVCAFEDERGMRGAALRPRSEHIPKLLGRYGDAVPMVCISDVSYEFVLRFAAYYFITPHGEVGA